MNIETFGKDPILRFDEQEIKTLFLAYAVIAEAKIEMSERWTTDYVEQLFAQDDTDMRILGDAFRAICALVDVVGSSFLHGALVIGGVNND